MALKNDESIVSDLLPQLPKDASRIVEFGLCPTDIFKFYSEANPAVDYYAVNHLLRKKAIALKPRKGGVTDIIGNAESLSLKEMGVARKSVDCIILLNVLENMIDPWSFMNHQVEYLSENGMIIAVFQNFGHWSTIYNLIVGKWFFKDNYVSSKERIRFFSAATISELFEMSGLRITKYFRRILKDNKYQSFFSAFSNAFQQLNVDLTRFEEQATTLKYIVPAKKDSKNLGKEMNSSCQKDHRDMKNAILDQ
ncbi:MAG: hypothetical protein HUN05_20630 [Desulfobacter sp.]|nr:MAG: hypothetical protein HUN05_20630 [Desulfobacter sp.]